MGASFTSQSLERVRAQKRKSRWYKVIAALSAVVVFCTTYALILPAITKEQPVYCGYIDQHTDECYEEVRTLTCTIPEGGHVHTDKCYETKKALSCTLTEGEGHTHSDACYETIQTLVCTDPEHTHDESCYTESRVLICGMEEAAPHHHSDSCYTEEKTLVCGCEEAAAHTHTDECYTIEKKLICDHKVHEHTLQCYSDPEVDVETREIWERTVERVVLTDDWNADVLAIAKTQLGYHESERNYEVQANGVSMKGYTRYGAWYGIPYGDWCAMFCSFCLNYAEVDPKLMPRDANCPHWIRTLSSEDFDLYHPADRFVERLEEKGIEQLKAAAEEAEKHDKEADEAAVENEEVSEEEEEDHYIPRPGDLIFFDWNSYKRQEDRESDHIGFVAELIYEEVPAEFGEEAHEELTKIKTIEGNSANQVRYVTYDIDDDRILGYGEIPEKPKEDEEEEELLNVPSILSSWLGGSLRLMAANGPAASCTSTTTINFANANNDGGKYSVINPSNSYISNGFVTTTTRDAFEPAGDQLKGTSATTPKDAVSVPVSGDWTATLKFDFSKGSAQNGWYQFFGFYAAAGNDYNNMIGIRGGEGAMQDFVRKNGGNPTTDTNGVKYETTKLNQNGTYWYRIVKSGTTYTCYVSTDGTNFNRMFQSASNYSNTGIDASRLLIDAYTGMTEGYTFYLKTLDITSTGGEHSYEIDHNTATCTEGGIATYHCTKCGDIYTTSSEPLGHSFVDGTCTRCGEFDGRTRYYRKPAYEFRDLLGSYAVVCLATNNNKDEGAMNGNPYGTTNGQGIGRTPVDPENGGGTIVGEDLVFWTITRAGAGKVNLHCTNGYLVLTHNNGLQMTNDAEQATDFSVTLNSDGSFRLTTSEGCINSSSTDPAFINYRQAGDDLWLYTVENENPLSRTGRFEKLPVTSVDQMVGTYAVACTTTDKTPSTIQAALTDNSRLVGNVVTREDSAADYILGTDVTIWEIEKVDNSHVCLKNGDNFIAMAGSGNIPYSLTDRNHATSFAVEFKNDGGFMLKLNDSAYVNSAGYDGTTYTRFSGGDPLYLYRPAVNTDTNYYVWLDGTDGGLMNLTGSPDENRSRDIYEDNDGKLLFDLPATWQSPIKYNYTLAGWYDIYGKQYYLPGETAIIDDNTVFYADWRAASYDVGQSNEHVIRDVDTSNFITTYVFDYSVLFNAMSTSVAGTVNSSGHSETWTLQQTGINSYTGIPTLDFVFVDYDHDGQISYANNREERNFNRSTIITPGILEHVTELSGKNLLRILFDPASSFDPANHNGYIGVNYIGTGDFFYHYMEKGSENYDGKHNGYYYYDSTLNAASYNQSMSRFYVYDYLERTTDSRKDGGLGVYSDILPFNSPYVNNPSGKSYNTDYHEDGTGKQIYEFDAKGVNNDNGVTCNTDHVITNYFYGIRSDVQFYLPNDSGYYDSDGNLGNQSIKGDDMFFEFSGDDDVWVFVDDQLILDIGGLHGVRTGNINFSTGEVNVYNEDNTPTTTTVQFTEGEHVLHFYYMERGSSQANGSIYFNLAPRYTLRMLKEDIFTQLLLDGAEFTVYTDLACTQPARLWHNEAEYRAAFMTGGESAARDVAGNTFTVSNGFTTCWGMAAGQTYYLKETKPPTDPRYQVAYDLICMKLNARGGTDYSAVVIDGNGDGKDDITVPSFDVDEETKMVDISVTNRQQGTVEMSVQKFWNESGNVEHAPITVYLRRNGERIGDPVQLTAENGWRYTWVGLPECDENGKHYSYVYDVVEFPIAPGYESTGEWTDTNERIPVWKSVGVPKQGQTYRLLSSSGALACSPNSGSEELMWIPAEEAEGNPCAEWTATVDGSGFRFVSGNGHKLAAYLGENSTDGQNANFFAGTYPSTGSSFTQTMYFNGNHLYASMYNQSYYLNGVYGDNAPQAFLVHKGGATTSMYNSTYFNLYEKGYDSHETKFYKLTNTPIPDNNETAVKVTKAWTDSDSATHPGVTIRLYRNGEETGRVLTLNSTNGWTGVFNGLPKRDANGHDYTYTVQEDEVGGYRLSGEIPALTFVEDEPDEPSGHGTWTTINAASTTLSVGDIIRFGSNTSDGMYYATGTIKENVHYYVAKSDDSDLNQRWEVMSVSTSGGTTYYTLRNVKTGKYFGYSDWNYTEKNDQSCPVFFRSASGGQHMCYHINSSTTLSVFQNSMWDIYSASENGGTALTIQKFSPAQSGPDPYTPEYQPTGAGHYEVTVTNKPIETISLRTNKTWSDGNDAHAYDSVTVRLLADGEPTGKSVTLSAENGWQAEFTLLPKYRTDEQTPIVYTLSEDEFFGYAPTYGALQTVSQGVYSIGITNAPPAYVLPESGGGGTTIFYAFGGAMMLLAVMCGFSMRRKRERGSTR